MKIVLSALLVITVFTSFAELGSSESSFEQAKDALLSNYHEDAISHFEVLKNLLQDEQLYRKSNESLSRQKKIVPFKTVGSVSTSLKMGRNVTPVYVMLVKYVQSW